LATILIVDDEGPVRQLISQVLKDGGHHILQAIHGAQALEMIGKDRPDLVLSDVMMPVLSGAELCRQLKASADTRSIPVILMSSAGRQSADGAGGDAFLEKPFHFEDLEDLVRRWLAR
jgi:CheY-like chemotaxis protein